MHATTTGKTHTGQMNSLALARGQWCGRLVGTSRCWRSPHPSPPAITLFQRRTLAQSVKQSTTQEGTKPKPKASTSLRRAAAESLPIRSNRTPTRSDIQPIVTLATAERYNLLSIKEHLPPSARHLHESWWVPKWGESGKEGEIFIFGNGSFVCWGLDEEQARKFAWKHLRKPNVEVLPLREPETEDLEFVTDPEE